jgi:hypothetical protein
MRNGEPITKGNRCVETAKQIGLAILPNVLARADRVISSKAQRAERKE